MRAHDKGRGPQRYDGGAYYVPAAPRQQQGQHAERRQHQVLKAERAILPFIGEGGAEGEVVGRVPGERALEPLVYQPGVGGDQRRGNLVVQERKQGIAGLGIGDDVRRRRRAQQQYRRDGAHRGRPRAQRFPVARRFHGQERNGQRDKGQGAELDGHRRAAQHRRQIEEALLAGVAEAPQRGDHPHHHGGQHVLHEERTGDQLHHRGGSEQRQKPEGRRGAHPSAQGEIEYR